MAGHQCALDARTLRSPAREPFRPRGHATLTARKAVFVVFTRFLRVKSLYKGHDASDITALHLHLLPLPAQYHHVLAMRWLSPCILGSLISIAPLTVAFSSFGGANNYYAYALPSNERYALLQSMNAAGMKVGCTQVYHCS